MAVCVASVIDGNCGIKTSVLVPFFFLARFNASIAQVQDMHFLQKGSDPELPGAELEIVLSPLRASAQRELGPGTCLSLRLAPNNGLLLGRLIFLSE